MGADVSGLMERVDVLLGQFESREKAEELLRTIVALYGEGLSRMLQTVRGAPDGEGTVEKLCADPFVASLLLIHDLHPVALDARLRGAIESVRPYLRSHGGEVEILGVRDGVVEVRTSGTCDGCSAAAQTLKRSIERAVFQAAPEILEVRANAASADADLLPRVLT